MNMSLQTKSKGVLLFVDDEKNILNSLQRLFTSLKYTVLTATNGYEALNILNKVNVDVVISDMRMPEMDGATFLCKVAIAYPKVKRILLTGYADNASVISAINDGMVDCYLSKPWKNEELTKQIQICMES